MSPQPNRVAVSAGRRVELGDCASAAPVAGWWLNFVAGFVPVVTGLVVLAVDWLGVLRADSPFWTALGNLGFRIRVSTRRGPARRSGRNLLARSEG